MSQSSSTSKELFVAVGPGGSIKMGTCDHCVLQEQGRPERAWDNQGDKELDFDRDSLHEELARRFGIKVVSRTEYVCP